MTDDIHPDLQELDRRIERAIFRIPDRLSTPIGEAVRVDWAHEFARAMGGAVMPVRMLACLPFGPHLLTDPVVIRVRSGFVVLDHPERPQELEWVFDMDRSRTRVHIRMVPKWWSLFENRHPRLIAVPDAADPLPVTNRLNRLANVGWHGPFEAPPTWETVGLPTAPMRSLVRVEHPVDPAWFQQI
jgi:hypothetical protein